jgi:UDP-N-acetylglucosamine 2-epimerase (non-hydrolysing)
MLKILFILGTRPEAIKLAPLIKEFNVQHKRFDSVVCSTAQHREMLNQVLGFFDIKADYDLKSMKKGQSLSELTATLLVRIEKVLDIVKPDLVMVQGDTMTAFVGALSAHLKKIKIAHIEAGLRSFNKFAPFPEEGSRLMISHLADYHFTPTEKSAKNLKREGIEKDVFVVGNTVIDALVQGRIIVKDSEQKYKELFKYVDPKKRLILVTGHRRESFGKPLLEICDALKAIVSTYTDVQIVYPVHLNPQVKEVVHTLLGNVPSIHLIEPLPYDALIWLMDQAHFIITDSGGIQEEAPVFRKPLLITREVTERQEVVDAGVAILVGSDKNLIVKYANLLLNDKILYMSMSKETNLYGDGTSSKLIASILWDLLKD